MTGDLLNFDPGNVKSEAEDKILQALESIRNAGEAQKPDMGWVGLPFEIKYIKMVQNWKKTVSKKQLTLCVLGIGGSSLGAKAVYDFLMPDSKVLFFDNIDGDWFQKRLKSIDFEDCHFLAISKSGETCETLFQLEHVCQELKAKKLAFGNHITVITEDKSSRLKSFCEEFSLRFLPVPNDVGGRFSVFSNVGLAPLVWAGVPARKLFEGALWASKQKKLVAQIASFYLKSLSREEWINVLWMYVENLRTFGLWFEQLWAESLGKSLDHSGKPAPRVSTPMTCIGATDQHSLLQQFTEGPKDKSFLFIRSHGSETSKEIKKPISQALEFTKNHSVGKLLAIEAQGTQKNLDDLNLHTALLTINKNDVYTIGALIYLFELVVATLGEILEINVYNQPGVEAVKKFTLSALGGSR